jgi:membrane-bound lytic murein transglycosylase D
MMKALKNLTYSLLLYVAIPLALLFIVFQVTDKNSLSLSRGVQYLEENLNPVVVLNAKRFLNPGEEEEIPLIKEQSNRANQESVKAEEFIDKSLFQKNENSDDDVNQIPLEYADQTFSDLDILHDKLNRLPNDFKIPKEMEKRIGFWLDIYTKYSSRFVLIHDQSRPWIIYKVVDTRDIFSRSGNVYTKDANQRRFISQAREQVRKTLIALSKKKNYLNLSEEESKVSALLEEVSGKRQKVFRTALLNMREQRGQKNFYKSGLISGAKYLSEMEEIFAKYDLPVELVRLPLVESSFNEEAQSKVGASGIWQFMPGTGRKYLGMSRNTDERNSPIKATEAAAKLFRSNHQLLKTWPLTITAYNHGASGLLRARRKLKTEDLNVIINSYKSRSFSFASQNFFSEFMAALYAERYQEEIFGSLIKSSPLAADTLRLRKSMRVKDIADISGVTLEEIKLHNPDLRKQIISRNPYLPMGYKIRLPLGRSARLELYYQQLEDLRASGKKLSKKKTS